MLKCVWKVDSCLAFIASAAIFFCHPSYVFADCTHLMATVKSMSYSGGRNIHVSAVEDFQGNRFAVTGRNLAGFDRIFRKNELAMANFINKKTLDAGCGSGELVDHFREHGCDMVGIDIFLNPNQMEKSHFSVMDMRNTTFSESTYDAILSNNSVFLSPYTDLKFPALKELSRILKPSGTIYLGNVWELEEFKEILLLVPELMMIDNYTGDLGETIILKKQ